MRKMKISEALLKGEKIANKNNISIEHGDWLSTEGGDVCRVCAVGAIALACGLPIEKASKFEGSLKKILKQINGFVERKAKPGTFSKEEIEVCKGASFFSSFDCKYEPLAFADHHFEFHKWSIKKIAAWFKKRGM